VSDSEEWLEWYYERLGEEKNVNLQRKDSYTNWALVTLLGVLAIYGQLFLIALPAFITFAVLAICIILIFRFYLRSCISYADIRRQNLIRRAIERYWMHGKPSLNRVKALIKIYDHECWAVNPLGRTLRSQLKAGFIVLFLAPILALGWETINLHIQFFSFLIPLETLLFSYAILAFLIIYIILELIAVKRHKPLQQQPKRAKSNK
jgi:hypothetical protein